MAVLFCCEPENRREVDTCFAEEANAATRLGMPWHLVDFEALVHESDAAKAVRRVPVRANPTSWVYRGWMLTPSQYRALYDALAAKAVRLINDAAAYQHCHYLPESYSVIEDLAPKSVWVKGSKEVPLSEILRLLRPFGSNPVIVKDYVKSRKHEWDEACFIPSAADPQCVKRVVDRFIELQDDDLCEGLLFREYVPFQPLTKHSKSGMPLTLEYRIFFLDAQSIFVSQYWEEGDYGNLRPPTKQFEEVAARVKSRFFTMDVAKRTDGEWMIVELGDGQVAGLPENADVDRFYASLKTAISASPGNQ